MAGLLYSAGVPFSSGPIVYRLGHLVLIQESGVRFPVGLPLNDVDDIG